jgi:soluble lytic murein transglycosylase
MAMGRPSAALHRWACHAPSRLRRTSAGLTLLGLLAGVAAAAVTPLRALDTLDATVLCEPSTGRPGGLLRKAVDALERGETRRAESQLVALAEGHPIVADYADLLRMRLLVDSGRHDEAIAMREQWQHADSPLQSDFFALLGRAHAARGDASAARTAWQSALDATDDPERRAALRVEVGASFEQSGELEAAAESYLRVWTTHPLSPEADVAAARLDELEGEIGSVMRSASQHRKRADALYRRRRNEAALASYETALASGELSAAEQGRAQQQRARTLFRMRRYPEAAQAFAALPPDDDTAIWRARSLARAGQVEVAARQLEQLGRSSGSPQAARANLLAALLREGEGDLARAHDLYTAVVTRAPASPQAPAASWRLGWAAYREGSFDQAIRHFDHLGEHKLDALAALRGRYWRARARQRAGHEEAVEEALEEFAAIAREFPLSYYGWRARSRSDGRGAPELVEVEAGTTALGPSQLARPRILLEAGLVDEARQELDRLYLIARGREDRLTLAQLYADAGDFYRPQRLMVDAYTEPLARGPTPGQLQLWWHAWPAPFGDQVRAATDDGGGLEPALLYAVMREESGYRPRIVSVSGARGLLQLMPDTAAQVARKAGMPEHSEEDLFLPRVNIRLGALYLDELLRRFDGRISAAVGSYNAGPQAVARWLKRASGEDDEWVESIGYEQTRGYVKRVLRSLHAYRVLY